LTKAVIALSGWMQNWGLIALGIIVVSIFALRQALKTKSFKYRWDIMMLRLPLMGKIIRNMNAARFARTMAGLVDSGTPALTALETARHTLQNAVMREAANDAAIKVREGSAMSTALRGTAVFPPLVVQMVAGGEASGDMGKMFAKSADYFEDEFSSATDVFLALLEPLIIIFLAGIVLLKEMKKKYKKEDGFTLVEVMVTLVIIGLLTTFVVINVLPAQDRALTQKAKGDIRILEQAMEMYRLDNFDYPEQEAGLEALKERPNGVDEARYRKGGYIKLLPADPWGRPYVYLYPGENGVFDIVSYGSDGEPGGEDQAADIVSWE